MDEHKWNLVQLLRGVKDSQIHSRIWQHTRSMARWTIAEDSSEPAYPGLQTEEGFNLFVRVKEQMYQAIRSGNYTVLKDGKRDALCRVCGNLTKGECRLRGKQISIR